MSQYYLLITSILLNVILGLSLVFARRRNQYLERNNGVDSEGEVGVKTTGSDLFLNLTQAKSLSKELKIKIHPDRFHDQEIKDAAQELYKQVSANTNNFRELQRISIEVDKLLNMNDAE